MGGKVPRNSVMQTKHQEGQQREGGGDQTVQQDADNAVVGQDVGVAEIQCQ